MTTECECGTVKFYDDHWQCILCRRKFMPVETAHLKLEEALKARNAQVSVIGNMMVAVIQLTKEELDEMNLVTIQGNIGERNE